MVPRTGLTLDTLAAVIFLHEEVEHFLLDLHGIDHPVGADGAREPARVVAAAATDVGDGIAAFELERRHEQIGALFLLPFGAFKPVGGLVAHDVRNLAAHEKLADAIRVMLGTGFVARGGRSVSREARVQSR